MHTIDGCFFDSMIVITIDMYFKLYFLHFNVLRRQVTGGKLSKIVRN